MILLNVGMWKAQILRYLVAKGAIQYSPQRIFFLCTIFASIMLKSISTVHKNARLVTNVYYLQFPFSEIDPRVTFNFSLSSFQLEHKQPAFFAGNFKQRWT